MFCIYLRTNSDLCHLQRKLIGHTFLDYRRAAAIQEPVTAVLRSIPKEAFADSFQKFMNVANRVL
jgi:hypothetical protein